MTEETKHIRSKPNLTCENIDDWERLYYDIDTLYVKGFLSKNDYNKFCGLLCESFSKMYYRDTGLQKEGKQEKVNPIFLSKDMSIRKY
jgi:hypothetical protein